MAEVVNAPRLPSAASWAGRRVLVTGHTGFKGAWLSLLLHRLGATVHGISIDVPTEPSLYRLADLRSILESDRRSDVTDIGAVAATYADVQPEVVFHLAAQPLVLTGFADPLTTFRTNAMGTLNVLDVARHHPGVRAVVVITTDKVYRNREHGRPFVEGDELGGSDPYSASKACAELIADAYRHIGSNQGDIIATARAGNVIGGGDWSPWRLLPDILNAIESGTTLTVRNPESTRPWQHVLDPLVGYLLLAESTMNGTVRGVPAEWNFGPNEDSNRTVMELITETEKCSGTAVHMQVENAGSPEHKFLALDSSKARELLQWRPRLGFHAAVQATVSWDEQRRAGANVRDLTERQIIEYLEG